MLISDAEREVYVSQFGTLRHSCFEVLHLGVRASWVKSFNFVLVGELNIYDYSLDIYCSNIN